MNKITTALIATSFFALTVSSGEVKSQDATTTPAPAKHGFGEKMKDGTEGAFKDLGNGVKKVGSGIDKGAKETVKVTKEGVEKVTPHKKHKTVDSTTSTTTTTTTTPAQ